MNLFLFVKMLYLKLWFPELHIFMKNSKSVEFGIVAKSGFPSAASSSVAGPSLSCLECFYMSACSSFSMSSGHCSFKEEGLANGFHAQIEINR